MMQERLNRIGQGHIRALGATAAQLWREACQHDNIETGAQFVIFSDENPYRVFYENAVRELLEAMQQYAAGGYVGLKIDS